MNTKTLKIVLGILIVILAAIILDGALDSTNTEIVIPTHSTNTEFE